MSVKEKWKNFGKSTGKAFSNFGHAVAKTTKNVFSDEENDLKEEWKKVGKGFGEAGTNLGHAAKETIDQLDEETKEENEPQEEAKQE